MKKVFTLIITAVLFGIVATTVKAGSSGFDEYGFNESARIFNGTGESYSLSKGDSVNYFGIYSKDKLLIKWNIAWDTCWLLPTVENCKGARQDTLWNGKDGGSGQIWHIKIVWTGIDCGDNFNPLPDGGYCIYGQFETIGEQGFDPNMGPGHYWFAHSVPNGYGGR